MAAIGEADAAEVVVTVDRRTKNLQDYSGVAAAFSEKKLTGLGITSVQNLGIMVPGLQTAGQEGSTEIYIRGVGSDNNTELGDPGVALHVDGVYIPRPRGLGATFFDLERVEVSSGPQGTLRGRNALGGTVNLVTAQPKLGEYGAYAEATFGNYSLRRYQGMVNIPLGSSVAFRAAGYSEVHDPYWVNAGPIHDLKAPENADAYALRGTLKYQPSERFVATLAYDFTAERGTGSVGSNFQGPLTHVDDNGTPANPDDDTPAPVDPSDVDDPRSIYMRGMQPYVDMKHQGVRLTLTFDAGPVIFEALGSYRDLEYKQITGSSAGVVYDGFNFATANPDQFGGNFWDNPSQSIVAELRAYAPDTARFRWTVGTFYFNEKQGAFLGQTSDPHAGYGGGEFNMPNVDGGSIAGYADGTFDIVEEFRVLGGVRVTHETKSRKDSLWAIWTGIPGSFGRYGTEGFQYKGFDRPTYEPAGETVTDRVNFFLDGIESFGARDTVPVSLCNDPVAAAPGETQQPRIAMNAEGNFRCTNGVRDSLANAMTDAEGSGLYPWVPQDNEVDNTFFDWRVGAEYDLAPDNLLYATVSTGHKAGGFNDTQAVVGFGMLFNSEYDPESMIAFEVGSKNTFLNRALRLNGSAFFYTYSDLVFQTIVQVGEDPTPNDPSTGPPASAVRQNADAAASVLGLDLDLAYRLPAGLEAEVHVLLMDSRFGDGTTVDDSRLGLAAPYVVDIGGNQLPRSSVATINYALSQLIFTPAGSFNWIAQAQTRTEHFLSVFNGDGTGLLPPVGEEPLDDPAYVALSNNPARLTDVVPTYTRFDIGAGWTHPDGRLSISGFVNNLTNITYTTSINSNPGANTRYFNPPRTAGIKARIDW